MTTASVDAYRGMNFELAERIAPSWERRRADIERVSAPVTEWLLRELRPQAGQTVLELAGGTGDTGFAAAAAIGDRGRLITTDFSPAMLDAARRRGAELGVTNVDYRVVDAESMALDDDTVDGVLCRFGYMLMADPDAALAETRRVLRPGGRLALAVWGAPERNPFFTAAVMGLVDGGHMPPPDPSGPGLFRMGSEAVTAGMLRAAGFDQVRTEEVQVRFDVPDIDEYLRVIADTAGALAFVVRGLVEADREQLAARATAALARFAGPGGYRIPGAVICAVGS